jgi:hypothetical protein
MKRWSSAQLLRATEFVYASLALFALTQGPVLRLWSQSAVLAGELPNPSIPHAHFSTYVAVQLPALALLARRISSRWLHERANVALLAFIGWLGMTVIWSSFGRHSLPEFVALTLTTAFGLYLATSFTWKQLWWLVASAMGIGVGVSWVAIMRLWAGAVNFQEDYWVGIYYNRNSLAPVAATAIIASVALTLNSLKSSKVTFVIWTLSALALAVLAGIELWRSESQTSPAALVIAGLACSMWLVLSTLALKMKRLAHVGRFASTITLVVTALAVFLALRQEIGVGGVQTATTAFNQRSGLWTLSWDGFLRKPWHGWGWMAAWRDPQFLLSSGEATWMAWGLEWSHSGYHDVLLGGGIPAAILFAAYLWFASRRIVKSDLRTGVTQMLLVVYVLAAATQESFFIGSHYLWALLVACLATSQTQSSNSIDEQHSSKSTVRSL